MRKLSSSDRAALIKLASSLPSGSSEKKAILAGLRVGSTIRDPKEVAAKLLDPDFGEGRGLSSVGSRHAQNILKLIAKTMDEGCEFTERNINDMNRGNHSYFEKFPSFEKLMDYMIDNLA
jgi:hypothetical protein